MASAIFKCPKCNKEIIIYFKPGQHITNVFCDVDNTQMERQYGKVEVGDVVSDTMLFISDKMLHGTLPSGKDKRVF
jgi:transcription elongation factor Elf1